MDEPDSDILTELEHWYAGENGRYLLQATRDATREILDTAFGYHLLQLGVHGASALCDGSPINHRVFCAERPGAGVDLIAHCDELPLESDSVDTLIAHHCVEFAANPHRALREMQRVLTPHGQLLVIGFNPYSLHGVAARARGLLRNRLWRHHRPVSERRLVDWLHLLDCEVEEVVRLYGLPPVGGGRLRRAMVRVDAWCGRHNLPLGGLYVLHARKRVVGAYRPRLGLRRGRLIGLVPKPAPTPTPSVPLPHSLSAFEKGDVAA